MWESEEQAREFPVGRLRNAIQAVIGVTPADAPSTAYELHAAIGP